MVNKNYPISDALNLMLGCSWRKELMVESVKRLGKPDAAKDLYEFACEKVSAKSTVI